MNQKFKMKFIAAAILAGVAAIGPVAFAASAADGKSLSAITAKSDAGATDLRFALSARLESIPGVFSLTNPHRVVFDLPGVVNATGGRVQQILQGDVQSVNLVQAQDITRVIVQLKEAAVATLATEGNELVVKIRKSSPDSVKSFSVGTTGAHTLSAVDFRRGPAGEGRVVVDLSDANTGIEISQAGTNLNIDFQDANIAEQLLRRMNVTDFGTPIKAVTLSRKGKGVRMVVEPQGLWEYNSYQTDSRFVMEVRPVVYDPNKLVQGAAGGYKGERMSLNFQNVEVRNLINVIADFTKLNIVTSDSVQGAMTIRLQDVPWDQALDIILQSRGLDMRKNGNVIMVAPAEEIAKREKDRMETSAQNSNLEPLRTESFQLNYSNTDDVVKLLTNKDQKILSSRGSVVADTRTNQIFVQDNQSKLAEVGKILQKIDIPVRQVMIEARIVDF